MLGRAPAIKNSDEKQFLSAGSGYPLLLLAIFYSQKYFIVSCGVTATIPHATACSSEVENLLKQFLPRSRKTCAIDLAFKRNIS
jgi:hypothetical protein